MPSALASTQPLVIAIGSSQGVESASLANLAGSATTFSTATIESANDLPDLLGSYSSCDVVILPTSNLELLKSIRSEQWQALDQWVRDGGACILLLGDNSREAVEIAELSKLLPGEIQGFGRVNNPGPLESQIGTNDPIEPFEATRVTAPGSTIDIALLDSLNQRLPWLTRHAYGFGTVQVVASDLTQPAFVDWADRKKLWRSLLSRFIDLGVAEQSQGLQVGVHRIWDTTISSVNCVPRWMYSQV